METHQRLAPCPAALEDRKLGPSTGMEEEIEDRGGRDRDQEGGRLYNFSHLVVFCVCAYVTVEFYIQCPCGVLADFSVYFFFFI